MASNKAPRIEEFKIISEDEDGESYGSPYRVYEFHKCGRDYRISIEPLLYKGCHIALYTRPKGSTTALDWDLAVPKVRVSMEGFPNALKDLYMMNKLIQVVIDELYYEAY